VGSLRPTDAAYLPRGRAGIGGGFGVPGDAGVPLYSGSQAAGNLQDVVNSIKIDAEKAKKVVADPKASKDQKAAAKKTLKEAEALERDAFKARAAVVAQAKDGRFVAGFGSNGGEEFLSFLNIGEMLVVKADKDWTEWDGKMQQEVRGRHWAEQLAEALLARQQADGSWANPVELVRENDPVLATADAVSALAECRKALKK